MAQKSYIFKPQMRIVESQIVESQIYKEESKNAAQKDQGFNKSLLKAQEQSYNFSFQQLRTSRVEFIEHCEKFQCFYIDTNDQVQKISVASTDFEKLKFEG